MPTQTKRGSQLFVVQCISNARRAEHEVVDSLMAAYWMANKEFTGEENDIDPATVLLGLQGAALGLKALCGWLAEGADVTFPRYADDAREELIWLRRQLDALGVVLPDKATL